MAKAKEKESLSAYFRRHFEAHPDWLEAGTNAAVIERWQNDHAGEERTKKIDQTLANVKSQLRKKHGMIRHRKRKRGRPPGSGAGAEVKRARTPVSILERLEGMIDQCLSFARAQNIEGFEGVINSLRHARNGVVWRLGQSSSP